jgi:hypothetical protein
MAKRNPPRPKRGDYVRATLKNGDEFIGRVQLSKVRGRVFVAREQMGLSDEGRKKPVNERSLTDLTSKWTYLLTSPQAMTVIGDDTDTEPTMLLEQDYAKRVAEAIDDGKPIPES